MQKKLCCFADGHDSQIASMINSMKSFSMTNDFSKADVLIYGGGADVSPKFYGEEKLLRTYVDSRLDELCLNVWNKYPEKAKVGICRGGQFLNVMSGGEMWQHVDNHGIAGGHETVNLLDINDKYKQGTTLQVTSTHHQMMIAHPEYGEVLAIANIGDGFLSATKRERPEYDTEVVWYEHTKCLCFQPHPEYNRVLSTREYFTELMEYFFK